MPSRDWKRASAILKKATNLASSPVGISLFQNVSDASSLPGVRQLTRTCPCQMAAWARYYGEEGLVFASTEGSKCVWGSACLGLIRSPQRLSEGELAWRYAESAEAGKQIQNSMGVLGREEKRFEAVLFAPLELAPIDPDVIIMYVTPAQALRLVVAYAFKAGEGVRGTMTGQSSMCSSIAYAYDEKRMVADLPCAGDRMFGLVQEHEMVMAFHASRTDQVLDGLRSTESYAGHPYKPFLYWPVILAPDMEPRRTDFD